MAQKSAVPSYFAAGAANHVRKGWATNALKQAANSTLSCTSTRLRTEHNSTLLVTLKEYNFSACNRNIICGPLNSLSNSATARATHWLSFSACGKYRHSAFSSCALYDVKLKGCFGSDACGIAISALGPGNYFETPEMSRTNASLHQFFRLPSSFISTWLAKGTAKQPSAV